MWDYLLCQTCGRILTSPSITLKLLEQRYSVLISKVMEKNIWSLRPDHDVIACNYSNSLEGSEYSITNNSETFFDLQWEPPIRKDRAILEWYPLFHSLEKDAVADGNGSH